MGWVHGIDYAFDRPPAWCVQAAGIGWVGRYIGAGTSDKWLTRAEAAAFHALGLSIVLLCEGFEDDALRGFEKGDEHATLALNAANSLGVPQDRPIYFAVDFDMVDSQKPQVQAYFLGVQGTLGFNRTGIYGGIRTVTWARQNRLALYFYQTYAWSAGQWADFAHIRQYNNGVNICGADVDLDYGVFADYGQWPRPANLPPSAPPPPPPPQSAGPWDYTGDINGLADDILGSARTGQNWATLIQQIPR